MASVRQAKFRVGQIVRHRVYPFRGVVFDIDPVFNNTEEWWRSTWTVRSVEGASVSRLNAPDAFARLASGDLDASKIMVFPRGPRSAPE